MAARIVVVSGSAAGTEFEFNKSVLRVGSAAGCDCVIDEDELSDHALTVQRRGNAYRVHNKTDTALSLGDVPLPPGRSSEWKSGTNLQLSSSLTLRLMLDEPMRGDSTRAVDRLFQEKLDREQAEAVEPTIEDGELPDGDAAAESVEKVKKFSAQDIGYLMGTAVIVLTTVFIGFYEPNNGAEKPAKNEDANDSGPTLVELLQEINASPAFEDELHRDRRLLREVRRQLREAYRNEASGDDAGAARAYRRIASHLLQFGRRSPRRDRLFADELQQRIYEFVRSRSLEPIEEEEEEF